MIAAWLALAGCGDPPPEAPSDRDADGWPDDADCADDDPGVHPGATDPVGDGLDVDCDGSDGPSDRVDGGLASPLDQVSTRFGLALAGGDIDGDGADEAVIGTGWFEQDSENSEALGAAWLAGGLPLGLSTQWGTKTVAGASPDGLGTQVLIADLSGDGTGDTALASWRDAYVMRGPTFPGELFVTDPSVLTIHQGEAGLFGGSGFLAADLTGDATLDLVTDCGDVTGPGEDTDVWGICALEGPIVTDRALAEAEVKVRSPAFHLGEPFAADLDGDGATDLLAADRYQGDEAGALYALHGPLPAALLDPADAELVWLGQAPGDWFGEAGSASGDVDGNGGIDIVVPALGWPYLDKTGKVYVFDGDTPALADASAIIEGDAGFQLTGRDNAVTDVDGDGLADLFVGAPGYEGNPDLPGRVGLFFGPVTGRRSMADADHAWSGERPGDSFGFAIEPADLDGDGITDLMVGAPGSSEVTSLGGQVYALAGPLVP